MLEAMSVRPRLFADVAECVRVLAAVRATDGYPAWWPADPAGEVGVQLGRRAVQQVAFGHPGGLPARRRAHAAGRA